MTANTPCVGWGWVGGYLAGISIFWTGPGKEQTRTPQGGHSTCGSPAERRNFASHWLDIAALNVLVNDPDGFHMVFGNNSHEGSCIGHVIWRPRFLSLLRPEGHVFHTAWETIIKSYYSTLTDWFYPRFIHININISAVKLTHFGSLRGCLGNCTIAMDWLPHKWIIVMNNSIPALLV